ARRFDAIQNSPERPWLRVDDGVFNPCFVLDRIRAGHAVAFHDVDFAAVKGSRLIEPNLIGDRSDIRNQRVSVPSITRIAHPPVRAVEVRPGIRMEDAKRMIVLVDNRKVAGTLKDLQWSRKIRRTRNAG